MANVHDVAAYVLKHEDQMTTMKLQKLCYYSQGWSLAWDGVPLFGEEIQAWMNGPVVYELFNEHRGRFVVSEWPAGNPDNLTKDERETIDAVYGTYGKYTAQQLSDMTHNESPWLEARDGLPEGNRSSATIDLDTMQAYFDALNNG